jgi:hypothetical protein
MVNGEKVAKPKSFFEGLPTCTITGLEKDTSYVFMVRAMNDRGFWSEFSDVSEVVNTKAEDCKEPTHLVVCCHGICMNEGQMSFLESKLKAAQGGEDIAVLKSVANAALMSTRDGVNIGGHRLALEIIAYMKVHPDITHISMIGHNIGGLYGRERSDASGAERAERSNASGATRAEQRERSNAGGATRAEQRE